MSAPTTAAVHDDAQRWRDWQDRGFEGDRRRALAMKWVMAIVAIALGILFGAVL